MKAERLHTITGSLMEGPLLITPTVYEDDRGFFFESWNQRTFASALEADGQPVPEFLQDNHSRSCRGVVRGLHYQLPPQPQGKLVRCVLGEIFDVAVDIRRHSPTFGHWVGSLLAADSYRQFWIPEGFAHGFMVLSEHAEVLYKTTELWCPNRERALRWSDPTINIDWPLQLLSSVDPCLSIKDETAPLLAEIQEEDLFN